MQLQSVWDTVGGVRITGRVAESGAGVPIVFVHGLGVSTCVATAAHALPYDNPATFAAIIVNFARHRIAAAARS